MIRIRFTLNQVLELVDCGMQGHIGHDATRSMILTEHDCEEILKRVPRTGRTRMSIRRKVASALERKKERSA